MPHILLKPQTKLPAWHKITNEQKILYKSLVKEHLKPLLNCPMENKQNCNIAKRCLNNFAKNTVMVMVKPCRPNSIHLGRNVFPRPRVNFT